ncbi:hypothetical protein Y1Q_0018563 [Alligator mississippiensis]|uniref:Uncharacterized protein n=1 Tax=Alligator mississippiensis TaxID=8496 RepID=A0A151PH35_ALLMI|nr:hypothetical protein Y1Q_0018563 [Alligator mississippiensis]
MGQREYNLCHIRILSALSIKDLKFRSRIKNSLWYGVEIVTSQHQGIKLRETYKHGCKLLQSVIGEVQVCEAVSREIQREDAVADIFKRIILK